MANAHCAAAIDNFLALEMHSVDLPWWDDLVEGMNGQIVHNGSISIPDAPGLGIELNEEAIAEHLAVPSDNMFIFPRGLFKPTDEWNDLDSHDRTWS